MDNEIRIVYSDEDLLFCIKPSGILSTDVPGGMPEQLRKATGKEEIHTVHRLDQVVSGLMVVTFNADAARFLSEEQKTGRFIKTYLAVISGKPGASRGTFVDYLQRDKEERKTYVVPEGTVPAQRAELDYLLIEETGGQSLVKIRLHTGRTHQIRCQFASRGMPVLGDRKYSDQSEWTYPIALWSYEIMLIHPVTGKQMTIRNNPPGTEPWDRFSFQEEDRIVII